MTRTIIILGAAAALLSGSAVAQSVSDPTVTSICLDPSGRTIPVTCHSMDASRINQREDICQCLRGGDQITVSFCPPGVTPPAESAAFEAGRRKAVVKGSLVGASWQGRPICVAPRNHLGGQY
ncbi:MAG: hypothetical protein JWP86_3029 [Phenylobacterium sp.]|nr:hypothetical protein [Phenylobacterium sp.]